MRTLFVLFLALVTFPNFTQAQETSFDKKRLETLKPGMAEPQVKQLLGEPIRFESFTTVKYQSYDTSVYWRYPDNTVVVVTNHIFERTEEDRDALLKYIQQRAFKKEKEGLVIVVNNGKK
jgi:outer membrane protein assembly factor BamE (lipoprotein component of BamABCDE complex)